jgi:hypothetical protein
LAGIAQVGIVGKPKIIVGAKVQNLFAPDATSISALCFEVMTRSDL